MPRHSLAARVTVVAGLLALCGCSMMPGGNPMSPSQTLTGTLHSVRPVGGGEPTGWILNMGEGSAAMGRGGMGMPVDVSKVKQQAMELDGKLVTAVVRSGSNGTYEVESFGQLSPSQQQ